MSRWLAALEDRTGAVSLARRLLARPVAGGPRWRHALPAALAAMLLLQAATGLAMTFFYVPGATTAWESVVHLEEQVLLGGLVRGLHAFGASAVIVLLAAHLLAGGLARAYRRPREAAWASGLVLVPLVLTFGLTGYLLPWDQKGYWATQVAVGIARATPLVGQAAGQVMQGGSELGTLTLTRFYALHTMLLPLLLLALGVVHVALVRRAAAIEAAEGAAAAPWWPGQAWRDALAFAVVALAVGLLAATQGAGLDAPADPASDYSPRPEWYFAPLRQLLTVVPEPWGSLVVPGAALLLVAALPWLDPRDRPRPRLARAVLLVPLVAALLLGLRAAVSDAGDLEHRAARARAEADAALARRLAKDGVPPGGAAELLWRHPPRRGARLFQTHCQGCHPLNGQGGEEAADLGGFLTRAWLEGVIRHPRDLRFFGRTELDDMPPLEREDWPKLPALVAFLRAQDPALAPTLDAALVAAGEEAYFALECHTCHAITDDDEGGALGGGAPSLQGYGTPEWLTAFLRDPGHERFYGDSNHMPAYGGELDEEELAALVVFLRGQDPARAEGR
ncbi:MAG: cytochrome b N-terminal domain-containing protein [Planctomycetes bacterium]|nr:cytochrome b N-terminal domain-containing protein [Planctomycetota bacterium]